MLYVGLDVHSRQSSLCILNAAGGRAPSRVGNHQGRFARPPSAQPPNT
jgi:hypothetical protein